MSTPPSDARRPRSTVVQQVASGGILMLLPLLAYAVALLLLSVRFEDESRTQLLREVAHTQAQALERQLESYREWLDFAAQRVLETVDRDPAECSSLFTRITAAMPAVVGGGYADAAGRYRCASPPSRLSLSIAERVHFQDAAQGAPLVISASLVSRVDGRPTVFIARRVQDAAGAFAGVVQLAIVPESLTRLLLTESTSGLQVGLVDIGGEPIASSHTASARIALEATASERSAMSPSGGAGPADAAPAILSETRAIRLGEVPLGVLTVGLPASESTPSIRMWGSAALGGFLIASMLSGLTGVHLLRRSLMADSRALDGMVRDAVSDPDSAVVPQLRTRESDNAARAFVGVLRRLRSQQVVLQNIASALERRTAELEQAQRLARLGPWEFDVARRAFRISGEACELLGMAEGGCVGFDEFLMMIPEAERTRVRGAFEHAIDGHAPVNLLHRLVSPGGRVRRVRQRSERGHATDDGATILRGSLQDVTDLESSRELTALYEAALAATADVVVIGELTPSPEYKPSIAWVNAAMCRLLGCDLATCVSPESPLLVPDVLTQADRRRIVHALSAGEPSRAEIRVGGSAGESRWLDLQVSPISGRDELRRFWVAVGRDTTERRLTENRIRSSEARYRHMFDDHPLPLWIYDTETQAIVDANRAAVDALGYSRAELLEMTLNELVPGDHRDELQNAERALQGTGSYAGAIWFGRKDGALRRMEVHGANTVMEGRSLRIISPIDRTEEHRAREALQRLNETLEETVAARTASLNVSQRRYRTLAELSPQVIWQADPSGCLTFLNRRWYEIVGERADGWIGAHWLEASPGSDGAVLRVEFAAAASERRHIRARRSLLGREGELHAMLTVVAPIIDADGHIESWVGVDTDVGEMEAVQRELSETVERLEAFSYSVSHDLRAPVHVIAGFAEALGAGEVGRIDEPARRYVLRIVENARRMDGLITDLLTLARIGRDGLAPVVFDLAVLLREVVEAARERDPSRPIRLQAPSSCSVRADPKLVRILLENLVENAVKFSARQPASQLCFTVQHPAVPGSCEAVFALEDNGVGFPAEFAERLFQPFQRLHTSEAFDGNGIGLAIAARIVGLHRGRIWAESGAAGGATFRFTLGPDAPSAPRGTRGGVEIERERSDE